MSVKRATRITSPKTRAIKPAAKVGTIATFWLTPQQIRQAKAIAARKSTGFKTQLRFWIAEGIKREEESSRC
jgi:hypothetical protein